MIHRECIVFYVIYRKDLLKIYLEQKLNIKTNQLILKKKYFYVKILQLDN